MEATTRFTAPEARRYWTVAGAMLLGAAIPTGLLVLGVHSVVTTVERTAYARGVCDHARDSRLLQPGRYDDCVRAVTKNPEDR